MSATTPIGTEIFTEKRLVICEGITDQRFFAAFIQYRGINGIQVIEHAGGKDGYEKRLNAIEINVVSEKIKAILLVIDSDNSATTNLRLALRQIRKTEKYGVPTTYRTRAKKRGHPAIAVLGIPIGGNGNIETMIMELLSSVPRYRQLCRCLTRYKRCSDANAWDIGKQSKMQLNCLLAATCKSNPECKPYEMWQADKGFRPFLDNGIFDDLETFLRTFATW